jgi:hypothetical protein
LQVKWEITAFGVEEHPPQTGCFRVLSFAERRIFDRGFESLPAAARGMVAERFNAPNATPRSSGGKSEMSKRRRWGFHSGRKPVSLIHFLGFNFSLEV